MGLSTSFDTEGVPDALRSARFADHMRRWFGVELDLTPCASSALNVQMQGFRGDRLRFASLRFSPHVTRFSGIAPTGAPRLLASLLRSGGAEVWQDGRTARVSAGQMVLVDPSRPFIIDSDAIETTSLYIDPGQMRSLGPRVRLLTATALDDRGLTGLFQTVARKVVALAPSLPAGSADDLVELLGLTLRSAVDDARPRPAGRAAGADQRARIQDRLLANLHDPDLSVSWAAQRMGLSPRRLQQLFANDGGLMRWVWTQRLDRCRRWLIDPARRDQTISEIAFSWGFSDSAHFARAFRAVYGAAPSTVRSSH